MGPVDYVVDLTSRNLIFAKVRTPRSILDRRHPSYLHWLTKTASVECRSGFTWTTNASLPNLALAGLWSKLRVCDICPAALNIVPVITTVSPSDCHRAPHSNWRQNCWTQRITACWLRVSLVSRPPGADSRNRFVAMATPLLAFLCLRAACTAADVYRRMCVSTRIQDGNDDNCVPDI